MSRFFAPGVESVGPGPSVQAAGDGLEGHYKAFLNSVPSNGSCLVVVPGLDPLHHMPANCPRNAAGAVGDQVFVGFDDEKSLWVVTPTTHTTEINGVTVPLTGAAWIPVTAFTSGWGNDPGFSTAAFLKDPMGFVHCKGVIVGGVNATGAFPFPVGYRPGATEYYPLPTGSGAAAEVQIFTNGAMNILMSATTSVGLSVITFLAEN